MKTVYSKIFPAENPDYKAGADAVAATGAQMVVLGSVDVPTVTAFIQAFEQQHYNPKIFAAIGRPGPGPGLPQLGRGRQRHRDHGARRLVRRVPNPLSQAMVKAYIAKYGGTPSDINADVAEAFSVGEVAASAATATKSVDNQKIINYLHSGVTLQTVQGPAKFSSVGENTVASVFIFQWQPGSKFVQVLPASAAGSVPILNPKPDWSS